MRVLAPAFVVALIAAIVIGVGFIGHAAAPAAKPAHPHSAPYRATITVHGVKETCTITEKNGQYFANDCDR